MHRTWLLIVTTFVEVGAGLFLLLLPSIPLALLLGVSSAAPESLIIARVAGAALFAIGVISFLARSEKPGPSLVGVLTGVLLYNVVVAALLAYSGSVLRMVGIALWPAVVLHTSLAAWCVACLRGGGGPPVP
jgi:hypothetical protein